MMISISVYAKNIKTWFHFLKGLKILFKKDKGGILQNIVINTRNELNHRIQKLQAHKS